MYLSTEHFTFPHPLPASSPYRVETLLEKGSGALNEDVLLQDGRLFGVFDGATSLDRRRYKNGLTGGLLAARIAAATFRAEKSNLVTLAGKANKGILDSLLAEKVGLDERHRLWSTSLAVIRLERDGFQYCQTGDAVILLLLEDGGYRLVTPEVDIDRHTLQLWKDLPKSEGAAIHDVLAEQIRQVRLQMNVTYGVLNGEPEALRFLCHGHEELTGVSDILLFTDGLFLPRENPEDKTDWHLLAELYRRGGLEHLHRYVRRLQRDDPSCRKYPRFKQHDDIAAVAIQLQCSNQPLLAFS